MYVFDHLIFSVHTYALLTKRVPSIWLGIGQFLQRFLWTEMRTRSIKSNNKRRARPISKRVIFFFLPVTMGFLPLANSTIWQITMYYRIQMFKEPRFADLTADQLVVGWNYRSFQLGFSRLTSFGAPLRLFRLSSVFRFGLEFFFFNITNQYHKSSVFDRIIGFKLFAMI